MKEIENIFLKEKCCYSRESVHAGLHDFLAQAEHFFGLNIPGMGIGGKVKISGGTVGMEHHNAVTQQQCFHFLAVAIQRGVRVDLDLHLARQALFSQALEHQRALTLRGVFCHNVGELDGDRIGRMDQSRDAQGQGAGDSLGS